MTNREKLLNTSEYDLLCRMNSRLLSHQEWIFQEEDNSGYICILEAITGQYFPCPDAKTDITGYSDICSYCIAAWLNSEYDGRW